MSSNPHPVRKLGAITKLYLITALIMRVPILTQSENWALCQIILFYEYLTSSNPHPVRKLGAIVKIIDFAPPYHVPILTQSENWALLEEIYGGRIKKFQSSPSPKTGRY